MDSRIIKPLILICLIITVALLVAEYDRTELSDSPAEQLNTPHQTTHAEVKAQDEEQPRSATASPLADFCFDMDNVVEEDSWQDELMVSLAVNETPPQQRMYVLYGDFGNHADQLQALDVYAQTHTNDTDVLLAQMKLCSIDMSGPGCEQDFQSRVRHFANNDGEQWLTLAALYVARQQHAEAFAALEQVLAASSVGDSFARHISQLTDYFYTQTTMSLPASLVAAIGKEATGATSMYSVVVWCSGNDDIKRIDLCTQLGTDLFKRGKTENLKYLGVAIHEGLIRKHYLPASQSTLSQQLKALRTTINEQAFSQAMLYLFFDETLLVDWLNDFKDYGEFRARENLMQRVEEQYKNGCTG